MYAFMCPFHIVAPRDSAMWTVTALMDDSVETRGVEDVEDAKMIFRLLFLNSSDHIFIMSIITNKLLLILNELSIIPIARLYPNPLPQIHPGK